MVNYVCSNIIVSHPVTFLQSSAYGPYSSSSQEEYGIYKTMYLYIDYPGSYLSSCSLSFININSLAASSPFYSVLNLSIHIYLSLLHTCSADKGSGCRSVLRFPHKVGTVISETSLDFLYVPKITALNTFMSIFLKSIVIGFSTKIMWVVLLCRNECFTIKIHILVSWVKA